MNHYKRILLKFSGDALSGHGHAINPKTLDKVVSIIQSVLNLGIEVGVVVGGGNIFRGAALQQAGMNRVTGDHILVHFL